MDTTLVEGELRLGLAKKALDFFLAHQADGSLDEDGFYCIKTALAGYEYAEEREQVRAAPAKVIVSRRIGLLIKASAAITEMKLHDMVEFDPNKREPKPYNGVTIANYAIQKDRAERTALGGVAAEYFFATVDGDMDDTPRPATSPESIAITQSDSDKGPEPNPHEDSATSTTATQTDDDTLLPPTVEPESPGPREVVDLEEPECLPKPFGVGGLLAFFAFICALQPLGFFAIAGGKDEILMAMRTMPAYADQWRALFYYQAIAALVVCSLSYVAGCSIMNGSKSGGRYANIFFIALLCAVFTTFFFINPFPAIIRENLSNFMSERIAGSCIWIVLWAGYINLSKRARNTFETPYPIPKARSCFLAGARIVGGIFLILAYLSLIPIHNELKLETSKQAKQRVLQEIEQKDSSLSRTPLTQPTPDPIPRSMPNHQVSPAAAESIKEEIQQIDSILSQALEEADIPELLEESGSSEPQNLTIGGQTVVIPCPRNSVMKKEQSRLQSSVRNKATPFRHAFTFTENVADGRNVATLYHLSYLTEIKGISIRYPFYLTFAKDIHGTIGNSDFSGALLREYSEMVSSILGITPTNLSMKNLELTGDYYSNIQSGDVLYKGRTIRIREPSVYFFHNNTIFHISATDAISPSESDAYAKVLGWRDAIIQANPIPQRYASFPVHGNALRLPIPRDTHQIDIASESSSTGYKPLAGFLEETEYYAIVFKVYHSRELVPHGQFPAISRTLATNILEAKNNLKDAYVKDPQYRGHRDPVILENSSSVFTNSQDVDLLMEGIPVRGYSLFTYFPLGDSIIQLRAICRYPQELSEQEVDIGEDINSYGFRKIVEWRESIRAANRHTE